MKEDTLVLKKNYSSQHLRSKFHEGKENHTVRKFTLYLGVKLSAFSQFLTLGIVKRLIGFITATEETLLPFTESIPQDSPQNLRQVCCFLIF